MVSVIKAVRPAHVVGDTGFIAGAPLGTDETADVLRWAEKAGWRSVCDAKTPEYNTVICVGGERDEKRHFLARVESE